MKETLPNISMKRDARYVTQQGLWSNAQVLGPLTDDKIEEYMLAGKYGPEAQARAQARLTAAEVVRRKEKQTKLTKEKWANLVKELFA